jgi:hypothetical protein
MEKKEDIQMSNSDSDSFKDEGSSEEEYATSL